MLNWIESYLSNRTQRISIDEVLSSNFNLKFGVPQGSCLGPLLGSLSIGDEWDDDDGIMTSCLKKFDARVSFSAGKMKS